MQQIWGEGGRREVIQGSIVGEQGVGEKQKWSRDLALLLNSNSIPRQPRTVSGCSDGFE